MPNWTQEDLDRRNREVFGIGDAQASAAVSDDLPKDLKPEWMIEADCTKTLEEDGWRALRTDPVSDRGRGKGFGEVGMADHLYFRYDNKYKPGGFIAAQWAEVLWIEFKSASGKPSKAQTAWHAKERARGALTLIAGQDFPASVEGFRQWYAGSGLQRRA